MASRRLHSIRANETAVAHREIPMSHREKRNAPFSTGHGRAHEASARESEWLPILGLLLDSPLIIGQCLCFKIRKYFKARRNQPRAREYRASMNH